MATAAQLLCLATGVAAAGALWASLRRELKLVGVCRRMRRQDLDLKAALGMNLGAVAGGIDQLRALVPGLPEEVRPAADDAFRGLVGAVDALTLSLSEWEPPTPPKPPWWRRRS